MLKQQNVKAIIEMDLDPRIKEAREMNAKLLMHTEGVGLDNYLTRINEYENEKQHQARRKHAISNKFLTEELLRPTDNVFNAKGGSKNYHFKTNQDKNEEILISKILNVKNGYSLSEYIENVWFNHFITDPNGLEFVETDNKGKSIYMSYKNIHSIRMYEQNGQYVNWVVFEPHVNIDNSEDNKDNKKEFWAVDEKNYYLYQLKSELRLIKKTPHEFGKVPAVLCSNIIDNITGWKTSPIWKQVELLDKYVVSNSVLTIAEFMHNYPREWTYATDCPTCVGTGMEGDSICSTCNGSMTFNKKDPTDVTTLRIPQGDEVAISPPSGFTSLPTEPWELMVKSVDRYFEIIFRSQWQATQEKRDNETATGRFIDVQPVNNRLNKYSTSTEKTHTILVDMWGIFYFPKTYVKSTIQYGRRYLIETPDQIWGKYTKSIESNINPIASDLLYDQYLESEFRENEIMFIYNIKKRKLDPFFHWDVNKVKDLNVDELDYKKKLYVDEFVQTKTINDIVKTEQDKLNKQFIEFINNKAVESSINNNNNE